MSILITGVTGTLGSVFAEYFLKKNKKVFGCSKSIPVKQRSKLENINSNSKLFHYSSVDLRKKSKINSWFKFVKKKTNEIEIIINCAAVPGRVDSFSKISDKIWREVFDINFFGAVNTINIFLPLLKKSKSKLIINILGGGVGWHNISDKKSPYITSKFAMAGLTECLSKEFKKEGVTILGIFPGPVDSKLRDTLLQKKIKEKKQDLSGNSSVKLVENILKNNFKKLSGKLLSSRFDIIKKPYNKSLYTLRRIDNKKYYF